MQPDYVRIELKQNREHEILKKILPDAIAYPLFYQPGKMQISMSQMGDFQGLLVSIPAVEEELPKLKTDWMKAYLSYIEKHLKITDTAFFISERIREQFSMKSETYETELKLLLLKETTEYLMRKHKIARQSANFLLIDDGTWHLTYALYQLAPGCNNMVLVSEREQELKGVLDDIFNEHGLVIRILHPRDVQSLDADIVVNLCRDKEKVTGHINGYSVIMDFGYSDKKAVKLSQINPKIRVYHTVKLKSMQDTIPLGELSQILYYKEPLFQRFTTGTLKKDAQRELTNLWDRYFVEMVRVF